jgi:hypothetical protein
MSHVTSIILLASASDFEGMVQRVNRYFDEPRWHNNGFAVIPHELHGGAKGFVSGMATGAFNYLDVDELISYMRPIIKEFALEPEDAQLIIKDEHEYRFSVLTILSDGDGGE